MRRAVAAAAILLHASSARAIGVARADVLFREGQALLDADDVPAACAKLAESHRLDPKLGRLLNLAFCHEKEEKLATAWAEFTRAADWAAQKDAERAAFAREHAAQIEPRLSVVRFELPPGVTALEIDGAPLATERWAGPVPLDPGSHAVVVRAGAKERAIAIEAGPGPASQRVRVPPFPAEAPPRPPAPRSVERASLQRPISLAIAGAGVVALGVSAWFGVRAMNDKSDARCASIADGLRCDADSVARLDDAHASASIATWTFVGGAAAIAAGAVLFLTGPATVRVTPVAGGARVGLGGAF
jgi:serine/threonine-protein kinase